MNFLESSPLRRAFLGGLAALFLILPAAAQGLPVDARAVLASQDRLLTAATDALEPHRPGRDELYFVGFAGWAAQDVFLKEGRYAERLFDDRFGTRGRSILLANNPSSTAELPIASITNLGRTLRRVAQRMDVKSDFLFLFLTSHGAPGEFAVRFDPLELSDLTPARLRRLLDESGIRWRVIVISACYSGSFVEGLKDPRTLILTAARKDRSSFGCTSEADFTYFGDAYFHEALARTASFTEAFKIASRSIAAREAREGLTPSEPQIYVGSAIRPRLETLRQELAALQ